MFSKKNIRATSLSLLLFTFSAQLPAANYLTEKKEPSAFSLLADDYEYRLFEYSPELGIFWGSNNVAQDHFTDYSLEEYANWLKQEDEFLSRLYRIKKEELKNTPEYITYLLLKETLEDKKRSRICREELWDINPVFGWHNKLAIVAEKQPVGTPEYRQLALARWQSFNRVVDHQISNLKLGLKLGYTAPKPVVERVLTQLKIITSSPIQESPYFDFARRDGHPEFIAQIETIIKTVINPSLQKYIAYLEDEYLPFTRDDIGISALPNGEACYQAKLKQETALDLTPSEIHARGLEAVQKLSDEIAEIGLKNYRIKDTAAIFARAKQDSTHYFSTAQAILDYNAQALEKVKVKAPLWFDLMPKTQGIIKAYPAHRAKTGASGEYHPPDEEGIEPGIFYINTYDPEEKSRMDQEATLFHELIPGHHFQIALTFENKEIPRLNRYLFNSGFGEGWALYVERLADEMQLYEDDISRLGMLSNESLRAARLVVDTGIHAFHWRRDQAIDYLKQHTALNKNIIEGEVDRYIIMPGQATAYLLGKDEIQSLRQMAQKELGTHFDIRQFHNEVLRNGMTNLAILQIYIKLWIKQQKSEHLKL